MSTSPVYAGDLPVISRLISDDKILVVTALGSDEDPVLINASDLKGFILDGVRRAGSSDLDLPSIPAGGYYVLEISVVGANPGDSVVSVIPPLNKPEGLHMLLGYVDSFNLVKVPVVNSTGAAIDPLSGVWAAVVQGQLPANPGQGGGTGGFPPPGPVANKPILWAPRDDSMLDADNIPPAYVTAVNNSYFDAFLVYYNGYTENNTGTESLRSPRSAAINRTALEAKMQAVIDAGFTKQPVFFFLTDFPVDDPRNTSAPAYQRSIDNMAQLALACANKGNMPIVEDVEQYRHDGLEINFANFPNEPWNPQRNNYWDLGWGIKWAPYFPAAKAYFKAMFGAMLAQNPNLNYGAYFGPYAGVQGTPEQVLAQQIGNGYKGYLAMFCGFVEATVDAGLVGQAFIHDMWEAYRVTDAATFQLGFEYRSQGILADISDADLNPTYKAQWRNVIRFGLGQNFGNQRIDFTKTAAQVDQIMTDSEPYVTGWRWWYGENRNVFRLPTPTAQEQAILDGLQLYRTP